MSSVDANVVGPCSDPPVDGGTGKSKGPTLAHLQGWLRPTKWALKWGCPKGFQRAQQEGCG